ncbi:amino acid ABC transporter ATP-binding protein [Clostridium estertheticum]|uniref:Polar amino acid ABC transporter ATP-binding protein n=1 Tax=Clostridium estertheticum subsp. estertheticum TaxID=1552 RepID=A0A1J0GKI3_9CLOT|nr:amino acid ABC transporter ATP-binding protein [Clostridium estertheticum]APC41807.1 polar amino acid ABC transporter ATP-binding protein [Clostridium estertheticum subsp. estertheticum]MBU3073353.1 amino acid ABC transporter ATP-binding protein [Clostridium estertheticum]MBU3163406.1 amino acid ABC transporter ATP-binding protein [Clostridium estertheticum]MBZ9616304.1 amino acid ABC transporter ATP-binding protein [Clostridium estertheticum subsp. laramiense]WAG72042.1 amino acid ABC tran
MDFLKISNINKSYGENQVLKNVSLTLKKGEVISIIGPSGSGKSTLLRCISSLEHMDSGLIEFNGVTIANAQEKINNVEVMNAYKKIGMVFQNFNLFPHKTVLDNIIEAPIIVNHIDKKAAIEIAKKLLVKVDLLDKIDAYPCTLSGGQKQRIAIARCLAMNPDLILFDEPTSALDPKLVSEVLKVIRSLAIDKISLIVVTHEMQFAREISDKIIFMENGEILENSTPEVLFTNPNNERIKHFLSLS